MIQRIQSVFLLLAAVCAFCLFVFPFASTPQAVTNSELFSDSLYNLNDNIAVLVLFCLAGGLAFVSIFLFKNRKTQLLLGRLAIIANIIGIILAVVHYINNNAGLDKVEVSDQAGLYLPVGFIIFALLAQRYINKDNKLVSSMDRLR